MNLDYSAKSAPVGGESAKVDKLPNPQAEKTVLEPQKPPWQKDARGSPGTGGALLSPTHNPVGTSSNLQPAESPEVSPPSPQSYGLGSTGGYRLGEGSSVPQSKKQPQ
jgi:hypothetical protein